MERSSTGIFSLCLKLYPGRYEVKVISFHSVQIFRNDSISLVFLFLGDDHFNHPKIYYRSSSLSMVHGGLIPFAQSFAVVEDIRTTFLLFHKIAQREHLTPGFSFCIPILFPLLIFLFLSNVTLVLY